MERAQMFLTVLHKILSEENLTINKEIKQSVKNQHHLVSNMSSVGDDKVTKDTLNVCIVLLRGLCVMCSSATWGQKEVTHCFLQNIDALLINT